MRLRLHSHQIQHTQLFIFISLSPVQKCKRIKENATTVFAAGIGIALKSRNVEGHTAVHFEKRKKKA